MLLRQHPRSLTITNAVKRHLHLPAIAKAVRISHAFDAPRGDADVLWLVDIKTSLFQQVRQQGVQARIVPVFELDVVCEAATQSRIVAQQLLHLDFVAGEYHNQIALRKKRQQMVDNSATVAMALRVQLVRFVDKENASSGIVHKLFQERDTAMPQRCASRLHTNCAFRKHTHVSKQARVDSRDGGLACARVAEEAEHA